VQARPPLPDPTKYEWHDDGVAHSMLIVNRNSENVSQRELFIAGVGTGIANALTTLALEMVRRRREQI
jgi:hypothetical protein